MASPSQAPNRQTIKDVAAKLFSERSYGATSLRQIAARVGVTLGTIYHYFPSKEDLLVELIDDAMAPLVETTDQVDERLAKSSPTEVLTWMVEKFVLGTLSRLGTATISDTELRSLSRKNLNHALAQRDGYQSAMERVVTKGVKTGEFRVDDLKMTVYAILTACNGIAQWYRPSGRLHAKQVAAVYSQLALRMCGQVGSKP